MMIPILMAVAANFSSYDYAREQCIAAPVDVISPSKYRIETGFVYGKKKRIVLKEILFRNKGSSKHMVKAGEVHTAFTKMTEAAKEKGFRFGVNSAFRSYREQYKLWKSMPTVAANPMKTGHRSHQTGHSVDFSGAYVSIPLEDINEKYLSNKWCINRESSVYCPTKFFWWLKRNAAKYGFKNNVDGEPWHWSYVGTTLVKK